MKIENSYAPTENMYQNVLSVYSSLFQQQQQQQLQQQQQHQQSTSSASSSSPSPTPSLSKQQLAKDDRLERIKIEIQESVRIQENLRIKLMSLAKISDKLLWNNSLDS